MGYSALAVTAPHATAYDEDYPTRSTENYAHSLHDILQDMEDAAGTWYLTDQNIAAADMQWYEQYILHANIKTVFEYAEGAIDTYRSTGTPTLVEPAWDDLAGHTTGKYPEMNRLQWENYRDCMKMMYFIYYMWKTEEDPLLLKEKLQELLVAWPLLDTTIELNTETGQSLKFYPSWKNVDL